jgi:hypothetical protein
MVYWPGTGRAETDFVAREQLSISPALAGPRLTSSPASKKRGFCSLRFY